MSGKFLNGGKEEKSTIGWLFRIFQSRDFIMDWEISCLQLFKVGARLRYSEKRFLVSGPGPFLVFSVLQERS